MSVGVFGLFMETHEDPSKAKSDGANMLKLDLLEDISAIGQVPTIGTTRNMMNRNI